MSSSKIPRSLMLATGVGLTLANRVLLRAGLRRRVDGWRRGAGLVLRGEAATFVLSAFSLNVWSDGEAPTSSSTEEAANHLAERLSSFLTAETELHRCVRQTVHAHRAERCNGPSYTLAFEPWVDGPSRFVRPDSWSRKNCSTPLSPADITQPESSVAVLLNVVCRIRPDGTAADLWVRANHVGIDGVPVQDMLSRLEAAWGSSEKMAYPTSAAFVAHSTPRKCLGREELVEVQAFIDFGPLLAWRKRRNAALAEPMTVSAAILWCLGRHETFSNLFMGTTVEVQPVDHLERGVGVVVVRPRDYFHRQNGLRDYVKEFNRQLNLTRQRRSAACKTIDAAALIPARLETELLRHALQQGGSAFGSLALSIIRDAKVFGAPVGDAGHADGFIALGSVDLPTADGRKVGCVTVKGPPAKISNYPTIFQEVMQQCQADLAESAPSV